jgi:nitrite reductase/ring-hydroxylating ferredoxin subunit
MPSDKRSEANSGSSFKPPWYYATAENKLKEGKLLLVKAGGRDILLVKTEGQINALSNICPHARCPMHTGRLEEFNLVCICHGRRFDVRTGECLNDSLNLKKYEWKLEDESIGIKIE